MPRPRRRLATTLFFLAFLALAFFFLRDLPRRWLESTIAEASGAKVRLAGLRIHSAEHFELVGLDLEEPSALPGLRRLEISQLEIRASLGELRRGALRELHVVGAEATLDDAAETFATRSDSPAPFEIRRLIAPRFRLVTPIGDTSFEGLLDLSLWQIEGSWIGSLDMQADAIELSALGSALGLTDLTGQARGLLARARLRASPGESSIHLAADHLRISHRPSELDFLFEAASMESVGMPPQSADLRADLLLVETEASHGSRARFPEVVARLSTQGGAAQGGHIGIEATSTVFESLRLTLQDFDVVDAVCKGLRLQEAEIGGFGVERLVGITDAHIHGPVLRPKIHVQAQLDATWLGGDQRFEHAGADLDLTFIPDLTSTPTLSSEAAPNELARWPLDFALTLSQASGMPADLFPLTAHFGGHLELDAPALDGRAQIQTALGDLGVSGLTPFDVLNEPSELRWRFEGPLDPVLTFAASPVSAAGRLNARGRLLGPLTSPQISAQMAIEKLATRIEGLALSGRLESQVSLAPMARTQGTKGDEWRATLREFSGNVLAESSFAPPLAMTVRGDLTGHLATDRIVRLRVQRFEADLGESGGLGRLGLKGQVATSPSMAPAQGLELDIEFSEIDLAAWQEKLSLGLAGFSVQGLAGLEVAMRGDLGEHGVFDVRDLSADGQLTLKDVGGSSENGARVLEGLSSQLELAASRNDSEGLQATATGDLGGFLVLWDAYFGDLSGLETQVDMHFTKPGGEVPRGAAMWSAGLDITPRTPREATHVSLDLERREEDLEVLVDARSEDLDDFRIAVLQPFQTEDPVLKELRGGAAIEASFKIPVQTGPQPGVPEEVRLAGRLRLWHASTRLWDIAADGLEMDLPFDLRRSSGALSGPTLIGSLAIESSRVGDLVLPSIASQLRISGDDIELVDALDIAAIGGRVRLERLKARDVFSAPKAESGLRLEGLSIERLTRALDLPILEGQLDGSLPRVAVDGERLQVDGGGRISLFGGEIRLRDITGSEIFTRFPRFRLSADIDQLELGQLTRRFDFGEMQGAISGSIQECILVGGAPVAFAAQFESVDKKGQRQTVDVKAVQNLTILGTGAQPSVFDRSLQRFLKRYRYKRLGLKVELKDDLLELRGLVHEGDRELFLQGSLLFGIDIVNAAPGQRVSYSAMLRRLENLDLGNIRTD